HPAAALLFALPGDVDFFSCNSRSEQNAVNAGLDTMKNRFDDLFRMLLPLHVQPGRVYIGQYPDPTHGDDGDFCNEIRLEGAVADNVVPLIPDAAKYAALLGGITEGPAGAAVAAALAAGALKLAAKEIPDGIMTKEEVSWAYSIVIQPLN